MTTFIRRPAAAKRIGVHPQSIKRYVEDPRYAHLNFPKPVQIGDIEVFIEDEIDAWQKGPHCRSRRQGAGGRVISATMKKAAGHDSGGSLNPSTHGSSHARQFIST